MRRNDADGLAFETIAAAGENGAKPHAQPGGCIIKSGAFLTLDFGAKKEGYCSDMTRTVALGEPGKELRKLYQIVLDAHNRAKERLKPGSGYKGYRLFSARIYRSSGLRQIFRARIGARRGH